MAVAGRRVHRHAHDRLVGARLPRRLRRAVLHEGRQVGEGGGRPRQPVQPGRAVHALPGDARVREQPHAPRPPHEACRRAGREQMGARVLGGGARSHRGKGTRHLEGLRPRVYRLPYRHRAQQLRPDTVPVLRGVRIAELLHGLPGRRLLLLPALRVDGVAERRLHDRRLLAAVREAL